MTNGPSIVVAASVPEACRLLADTDADTKVISGGTAVVLMMQQGLIAPEMLVSVADVATLRGIDLDGRRLLIGAASTLAEVASSPLVRAEAPSLARACAVVGNQRIRNVATIGGNVAEADYASDPPAALASLGALCRIVGSAGERVLPVLDIITGFYETALEQDELITRIEIPLAPSRSRATYLKFRTRSSEDRSCVGIAACADIEAGVVKGLDVVVGAVAARLQRFSDVLDPMAGRPFDDDVIAEVAAGYAERIRPLDDARGSAAYRSRVIGVLIRRALREIARPGAAQAGGSDG
jgi:carbon-monoxide dehydrogenase medium subunit